MEDLVAVEVQTDRGALCYFVTWGRIQDAVDPGPLEKLILGVAHRFAVPGTPTSARLCDYLSEARDAPMFYEALFDFAQQHIPHGPDYENWRREIDAKMRDGHEISFVGPFESPNSRWHR